MAHFEIHVGSSSGFTPEIGDGSTTYHMRSSTSRVALSASPKTPVGETVYVKFVYFDDHGNHGEPSDATAVTIPRVGAGYISEDSRLGAGFPFGTFGTRTRGSAYPPDGWQMFSGTWQTDVTVDDGTIYTTARTGTKVLLLKNTAPPMGTIVLSDKKLVTPNRTYDLHCEVKASSISSGNTVKFRVDWFDRDKSLIFSDEIYNAELLRPDVWQAMRTQLVPPDDARYVRFAFVKASSPFYVAIDRIIFEEAGGHGVEESLQTVNMRDGFYRDSTSGPWGDLQWPEFDIGGGGGSIQKLGAGSPDLDAWSESGVLELTAPASADDGIGISLTGSITRNPFYGLPPLGTVMQWKVGHSGSTACEIYLGLWSSMATYPDSSLSNTISGVGVIYRGSAGAGNWLGVCRSGTTETVVDLGVTPIGGDWMVVGFRRTTDGFQFTVDDDDAGPEITTNLPATMAMTGIAGIVSTNGTSTKRLLIDDFGLRAVMARNGRLPDDDEETWINMTTAFGHVPSGTQTRRIKVPNGYRLAALHIRSTVAPSDGDIVFRRDNDGTLTQQLASSPFDATTLTSDDEASPTLHGTTANLDTSVESWLRVDVTNLDLGGTGQSLEIVCEYTRL